MESTQERDQPCEARIDGHLASRIESINEITEAIRLLEEGVEKVEVDGEEWTDPDDARDSLDNFALAVSFKASMTVQLSTGGPGDQFEIDIRRGQWGWELDDTEATYRFLDWYDGATRTTSDEAVMTYLHTIVERMSECSDTRELFG